MTELCSGSITTDLIRVQCPVDGNAFWTNKTKVSSQITSLFWLTFIGKADGMCSYEGTGLKVRSALSILGTVIPVTRVSDFISGGRLYLIL